MTSSCSNSIAFTFLPCAANCSLLLKPQMPLTHIFVSASLPQASFKVGVQSLSKTSSLAPGVRQLRPVIYYLCIPSTARPLTVFPLPQYHRPGSFLLPQIVLAHSNLKCPSHTSLFPPLMLALYATRCMHECVYIYLSIYVQRNWYLPQVAFLFTSSSIIHIPSFCRN